MQKELSSEEIQEVLIKKQRKKELISTLLPFTGLVFIAVFLTIATKGLLIKESNLLNLVNQCFTVALVGIGAVFVYAHGGMDFSVGASSGLAQYVCIFLLTTLGLPLPIAILGAIATGVLASTLVGSASIVLRVPAFVTSLCVRAICAGILTVLVNGQGGQMTIDYKKYLGFNNEFLKLGILILMIAIGYYFFEKTSLGKSEKAIGGNILTAFQSGIKVNKNRILAYCLMGFCVGLAAFFQVMRLGYVSSNSGSGLEFDIMIAMVLGGFPMEGGSAAKIRSVIVGAITITILSNGLILWGVDVSLINGIKGVLLIAIVALSYDRTSLKQVNMMST